MSDRPLRPDLPRVPLILAPTPLHRLDRLSERLGIDLWIKRDDLTGFAMGGNKGRKLEFLIADALRNGAEVMVAQGAAQSNFIRQLGAACAMHGLKCAAVAMHLPFFGSAGRPSEPALDHRGGNIVADALLGVDLRLVPDGDWEALSAHRDALAAEYEAKGMKTYKLAPGGSSALAAYAFYLAAIEAEEQAGPFDTILTPSSSGSTHAGLALCHHNSRTRVIGVCADMDPDMELAHDVADLCERLAKLLGLSEWPTFEQIEMDMGWYGAGYSVPSAEGNAAIVELARTEGIFLDPVYSGKAFAALLAKARAGELSGRVLFWHTGGLPTLFAAQFEPDSL